MKIEQQERSTKRKQVRISSRSFEETTLNKVKEKARIKLTRIGRYQGVETHLNIQTFESLILAQDERWRRA